MFIIESILNTKVGKIKINNKMKKVYMGLVLSLALVGLLAFPVTPVRAETVTIESLQALIEQLKAQIETLQNARNAVQETRQELRLNLVRFLQQ